ncbi:Csu type fimbrial protein [Rathayibacter festucae]|uniref:Csu type fimbrial protein n=1 Tax=Rathayibacter festucae TaxID=110937 RepID=UPI0013E36B18|nr:spore coat U domain-containing protein [Rathayibacter festucae]
MRSRSALALSLLAGGVLAVAAPSASYAASSTSSIPVSARIASSATLSASPLDFGNYAGAAVNATSTITVTSTNGTMYSVAVGNGTNSQDPSGRRLNSGAGASMLMYQVYTDSARTNVWGSSAGGVVQQVGTGSAQTLTVYGTIPAGQNSPVGSYSDTLTATVTY